MVFDPPGVRSWLCVPVAIDFSLLNARTEMMDEP